MTSAGFFFLFTAGMVFTTSKNILLNSTSVEDLSRTVKKWSLAVHLPNPPPSSQPRPYQTITFPGHSASAAHGTSQRTFAILYSQPGDNPFDLGPYNNFTSVMGYRPWDWILPLKHSPCCNHGGESDWPLGPVYDKMRKEAGLGER
jgi:palmitoyltransferase